MRLHAEWAVYDDGMGQALWRVYERAFAHLRITAVQRHVKTRAEFDATLLDKRIVKYFVTDDQGRVRAVASVTNEIDAETLLSPDYFAHRWPELYESKLIWYVGFLAVEPDHQGTGAFTDLVHRIGAVAAQSGGVVVLDVCRRMDEVYRLPAAVGRYARSHVPEMRTLRLDEQAYYAYEFPSLVEVPRTA